MLHNIYELETMEPENPHTVLFAKEQWTFGRALTNSTTNVIHYKFCELRKVHHVSPEGSVVRSWSHLVCTHTLHTAPNLKDD